MDLNIYPSRIGETIKLKISYINDTGEKNAYATLNINAPNLRTTEINDEHLFLMALNNLLLCSSDRGDFN